MPIEKIQEIVQARVVARRDLEEKVASMALDNPDRVVILKTIEETDEKIKKLAQAIE